MKPRIRLARAAYYNLFVDEIERQGAPVEQWLEKAGMPVSMRETPDIYISSLPFLHFLIEAEYKIGVSDMSGNAIRSLQTSTFSNATRTLVAGTSTLYCALCCFIQRSRLENSEQHYWIDLSHPDYLRVRSSASLARNAYHPNLLQNWAIIRIARDYLGNTWTPPEIGFQSDAPPGGALFDELRDTAFFSGQETAWVSIPKTHLWAPSSTGNDSSQLATLGDAIYPFSLPSALRELLKTEIRSGNSLRLVDVAESTGTSARSLQRGLKESGSSFRKALLEAKFEIALELLKSSENKIIDIAMSLGFADASHFSRMFRQYTGQSPVEFRKSHSFDVLQPTIESRAAP